MLQEFYGQFYGILASLEASPYLVRYGLYVSVGSVRYGDRYDLRILYSFLRRHSVLPSTFQRSVRSTGSLDASPYRIWYGTVWLVGICRLGTVRYLVGFVPYLIQFLAPPHCSWHVPSRASRTDLCSTHVS